MDSQETSSGTYRPMKQKRNPEINPHIYGQMTLNKGARPFKGEKVFHVV